MSTVVSPPEQRIILENTSWETYERLLAEHPNSASPRFTYDNGRLELMILSVEHERPNRRLALLVELIASEFDIDVEAVGSNTFRREDLLKGFEPDSAFYISRHAEMVRGKKRIDLSEDPPPDLVIEVDITSPSLPRFPIFAATGVPEVWRYDGRQVQIFELETSSQSYALAAQSLALPAVTGEILTKFLRDGETMKNTVWMRAVRGWAQKTRQA